MFTVGPKSKEGRRNQKFCANSIMGQIDSELRGQQYCEHKELEMLQNRKMRDYFEQFFLEEFSHEEIVLEVGMKMFEAWHTYQNRRNYTLAVDSLRRELSCFSTEILERFEQVLACVNKEIEEENKRIQKQKEREAFKRQFVQYRTNK